MLWDSGNIPEISYKYPRNIENLSEKNAESCVVCFATRCSKEEYQRLLWLGDRTLLHFNINIEQEAFQLEVGWYCAFTLHLDFKIEEEATQEFENAHS